MISCKLREGNSIIKSQISLYAISKSGGKKDYLNLNGSNSQQFRAGNSNTELQLTLTWFPSLLQRITFKKINQMINVVMQKAPL